MGKDRIIPDCIRALEAGEVIDIRSPRAVRPWEHVLEPLSGYMMLAQKCGIILQNIAKVGISVQKMILCPLFGR